MRAGGPAAARRSRVGRTGAELVRTVPDGLPVRIEALAPLDLATWVRDNAGAVDTWLAERGAVLLSGFVPGTASGVLDAAVFGAVSGVLLGAEPGRYQERSSPRHEIAPGVYTSTEQPCDQPIVLHNENAYRRRLPTRLIFGCAVAAPAGGATPLADCGRVLGHLEPAVADRFRAVGVRYTRVFGHGLGLTWQETFGTEVRAEVERYCAGNGIDARWGRDGHLRTAQVRPAVVRHPGTGHEVWLNHVHLFGPLGTTPAVRAALLNRVGADGLPMQVSYGDGAPIGEDVHRAVAAAYAAETVATAWRPGDVLVIDNLRVAHGREPYTGPRSVMVAMAGSFTAPAGP